MHHNEQILAFGSCRCRCHQGARQCTCQLSPAWRAILSVQKKSRKPRKVNLESRVKPFSKSRYNVMAIKKHSFHSLRQPRE